MKRKTIAIHRRSVTPLLGVTCLVAALALAGCKGGTGAGGTGDENAAVAHSSSGAADTNASTSGSSTTEPAATNQTDTSSQGDTNAPPDSSGSDTNSDSSSEGT